MSPREKKGREREVLRESLGNKRSRKKLDVETARMYYIIQSTSPSDALGCAVRNFNKPRNDRIEIHGTGPATAAAAAACRPPARPPVNF